MKRIWMLSGLMALFAPAAHAGSPSETLSVPTFGTIAIYAPQGPPNEVVLFLSGDGGWNLGVLAMAERVRDLGALVVGIDMRAFTKSLEASKTCAYPAGALEELARMVQLHRGLPAYKRPLLVGYSSGATLAYVALGQAPPETFAGAISLGFCPDIELHKAPCRQRGLAFEKKVKGVGYDLTTFAGLSVPWMVLQGEIDQVCALANTRAFVAATGSARLFSLPNVGHGFSVTPRWEPQFIEAYRAVIRARPSEPSAPVSMASVEDLGLVEVPANAGAAGQDMAVLLTGDGGWAEIDKAVAGRLAAAGVPVVAWSSLRYYWTPRTPESAAQDLARIVDHYSAAWKKRRVLLVGYSFGADVLPFLVNRLPAQVRAQVEHITLLGLSDSAAFEFHVSSWLGGGGDKRHPTVPEVARLSVPVTCVHGSDETESACLGMPGTQIRSVSVGTGHHFGGDYARLAELILAQQH